MTTKEYMVVLKDGVDYDQFWSEIENSTNGLAHIPDRAVDIADNLDALNRITHYFLTDQEAEILRHDSRVLGVEIPAEHRDDIEITFHNSQNSNFSKTSSSIGPYVNWGLIRNSNNTNVYGSNVNITGATTNGNSYYNYVPDGTNVDIVIYDSGVQSNHPEFLRSDGTSRVQTSMGNVSLLAYCTDTNGHGTHVAGIAAGKNYGWAKNANIYPISPTPPNSPTFSNVANIIISWHNSKPVNPNTGVKNPTVVNMSFGVSGNLRATYSIANATYHGTTYNNPTYGFTSTGANIGLICYGNLVPIWTLAYNSPIDLLIEAGIIVIKSAGNEGQKISINTDTQEWNNNLWLNYKSNNQPAGSTYYMRGGSPISANAIVVGALDSTTYSSTLDKKADYSNAGPGVPIFAAGSNIMSACSFVNNKNGQTYSLNNNTNTAFKQVNISGTSMAAPQIAGMAALYLQGNLTATPAQVKSWLLDNATSTIIGTTATNPLGTDYGNAVSQWGGNAGVAYQSIKSMGYAKDSATGQWKQVKQIYVKQSGSWVAVKKKWVNKNGVWVEST